LVSAENWANRVVKLDDLVPEQGTEEWKQKHSRL